MKTKILNVEQVDYVPEVGEAFTYKGAMDNGVLIRIPDEQGIKIYPPLTNKQRIFCFDLDDCEIGYLLKDGHEFVPLEPLGGEIVFQVRK